MAESNEIVVHGLLFIGNELLRIKFITVTRMWFIGD